MVITPIAPSALAYQLEIGGLLGELTRYGVRILEALLAMLLLSFHLAVLLGRTGAGARADRSRTEASLAH